MEPKSVIVKSAGLKVSVMDNADDEQPTNEVYVVVSRGGNELLRLTIDGDTVDVTYRHPLSVNKSKKPTPAWMKAAQV